MRICLVKSSSHNGSLCVSCCVRMLVRCDVRLPVQLVGHLVVVEFSEGVLGVSVVLSSGHILRQCDHRARARASELKHWASRLILLARS